MSDPPLVSIVIPAWCDERALARTLRSLTMSADVEVIVVCVLGEEPRYERLRVQCPEISWASAPRGRGVQMNAGAGIARGRWLLFLHADTELPPDWRGVVARADAHADLVAGAFRLSIDSRHWQARVVEAGVRLRVAVFGLPYGDQGLFVRRQTFDELGGYADLPLMEDIDLVRRLRKIGRFEHARSAVLTSPRRWQRDGWFRRSARNLRLATRFLLGAPPGRLAQAYCGRQSSAIVVMARAPWRAGKTRLAAVLGERAHADLRQALLLDTLDVVTSVPRVERVIACEAAGDCERMREFAGGRFDVLAQRGEHLGQRMAHVLEDVFRLGIEAAVIVGSDLPDLPVRLLEDALRHVRGDADRIVLGPAADGGYYLIGMSRLHRQVFERIDWGTDRVLDQTLRAASASGMQVTLLDTWADVDHPADLERLLTGPAEFPAARTRTLASRIRPTGSVARTD